MTRPTMLHAAEAWARERGDREIGSHAAIDSLPTQRGHERLGEHRPVPAGWDRRERNLEAEARAMRDETNGSGGAMDRRAMMAGAAALGAGGLAAAALGQGSGQGGGTGGGPSELVVLWTSADAFVAHRVGLMYTHAAKRSGWFDRVRLIAWGPSQRTLVGDKDLRAKVDEMQSDGVKLQACVVCADSFGVADELREIGFEVLPMGAPLTGFLKNPDFAVLTV